MCFTCGVEPAKLMKDTLRLAILSSLGHSDVSVSYSKQWLRNGGGGGGGSGGWIPPLISGGAPLILGPPDFFYQEVHSMFVFY